jgi:very-short-patch-repair endonuclease
MRSEPAPAERKVWRCLRNRRLGGFKFRRQAGIERYIVDYLCAELRLIVELDGHSHYRDGSAENDAKRTARLKALGYEVVRYTNIDVHENLDGLLNNLFKICEGKRNSTLGPSP